MWQNLQLCTPPPSPHLDFHLKIVHEITQIFKCNICNKSLSTSSHLRRHVITTHEKLKYKCDICQKGYVEKRSVDIHIKRDHNGIRDVPCELCGSKFSSQRDLFIHKRKVYHSQRTKKEESWYFSKTLFFLFHFST